MARFEFAYMASRRSSHARKPPPRADKLVPEYLAAIVALSRFAQEISDQADGMLRLLDHRGMPSTGDPFESRAFDMIRKPARRHDEAGYVVVSADAHSRRGDMGRVRP